MGVKVPDFMLDAEHVFDHGPHDKRTLPEGSFVKPISKEYLPVHIKKSVEYSWADFRKEIFCYTSYGIILIPKTKIRRASS